MGKIQPRMSVGDPYLIQFNLLSSCINDCRYCYLKSTSSKILGFKKLKKFLQKFEKYHDIYKIKNSVTLTGGDIFLHPELQKIVQHLKNSKNTQSVSLLINSLWHKDSKKIISTLSSKIDNIQLNIDNIEDRPEDLEWLASKKIRTNVKILLSKNSDYYKIQKKCLQKLIRNNPELYVSVDRLIPIKKEQIKNVCSLKELQEKINEVLALSNGNFISDDPLVNLLLEKPEKRRKDSIYGCSIGKGSVTVYPDGAIKLCARIPNFTTDFTIENFDLEKYILFTNKLMANIQEKCNRCPQYFFCNGGCPASSFVKNNKLSKDINCYYEK